MIDTVWLIVPDVPKKIRTALIRDARKTKVSMNEQAARILAAHCGLEREPQQTRFVDVTSDGRLSFRVPNEVRRCLRLQAAENGDTIRGLVIAALAEHYAIPFTETGRRPRTAA